MSKFLSQGKVLLGTTLTAAVFLSGCGSDLDEFVATNTTNIIAPVAVNDAFNALGNATVNQAAAGVLANDAINGGSISSYDAVGNQGGTIVLNADGSFAYTPVFGFVGQETFAYTLSNNAGSSTATVTMTSTGSGFFVDNTAAPGGDGSQASPFNTLAAAVAAAQSGDTIFVERGNGTNTGLTGGITLEDGVDLIGEGAGLIVAQTIVPAGQAPVVEGPITCLGNNTIKGLNIDGSASDLIKITSVGNVTISNNTLQNPTEEFVDCSEVTGTITIDSNTLQNPPDGDLDYIEVTNTNSDATVSVTNNTFSNTANNNVDSLAEMYAKNTSVLNMTFSNNIAVGTQVDQFAYGFYFENEGTGACTMTVDGNEFKNFSHYPIGTFAYPGPLTGTITSNVIDTANYGIYSYAGGGTQTVSNNVVSNTDSYALYLEYDGPLDGTFVIDNNNVSNAGHYGLFLGEQAKDTNNKAAIRNNSFTGGSDDDVYIIQNTGSLCCDITGNTFNSDVSFNDNSAGDMSVERFGNANGDELKTVNTFVPAATINVINDAIVDVVPGFCAIP